MNNASTSEYSSGCESGWTTYLDEISNSDPYSSRPAYNYHQKSIHHIDVVDDDEDLSMVSDASSAPPNSTYYGYNYYSSENKQQQQQQQQQKKKKKSNNKSRKEPKQQQQQQQNLCLDVDDTASSSIFHFSHSQDNVAPLHDPNSDGHVYSAAHFQGESVTKRRLGFFKSSTKGKSGSVAGRKRQ